MTGVLTSDVGATALLFDVLS